MSRVAILMGLLICVNASAQEQQYVYEVRGSSTSAPAEDRAWSRFYDTEAGAQAELQELQRNYSKGGILEFDNNKPIGLRVERVAKAAFEFARKVKEAREAVDKAKDIAKNGLTAEERKFGDLLKEYKNRLKDSFENATNAKKAVTSIVKKVAKSKFDEANKLIANFNQTRLDFSRVSQEANGTSLMPVFTPILEQYRPIPQLSIQDLQGSIEDDGKYQIKVFKNNNGQWVEQKERALNTNDEGQARKYFTDVKAVQGWTATSNLPLDMNPSGNTNQSLIGTWVSTVGSKYVFEENGRARFYYRDGHEKNEYWTLDNNIITIKFGAPQNRTAFCRMSGNTFYLESYNDPGTPITTYPLKEQQTIYTKTSNLLEFNKYNPADCIGSWALKGESRGTIFGDRWSFWGQVDIYNDGTARHANVDGRHRATWGVDSDGKIIMTYEDAAFQAIIYKVGSTLWFNEVMPSNRMLPFVNTNELHRSN